MRQAQALKLLKMGKNVFLTGEAGAGKTYLLNQYIEYLQAHQVKVAITASTGIAATHLHGSTIHAWAGIGIRERLTNDDIETILANDRIRRNYQKTRVLIIDEISMLHTHQLDMVDTLAREMLHGDQPFGGIQVILCGDFFQLPPVYGSHSHENKPFAFESAAWQNGDFYVCYLSEQHRQGDDPLYQVLNDIRSGTAGEHTRVPLRTRYKKEPNGAAKATKLYSRNINVDTINHRELAQLDTPSQSYHMQTQGFPKLVAGLKKHCLAPEVLTLKINAQVMFTKNDKEFNYTNGTRGVVIGFEEDDANWPIVKTYHGLEIVVTPQDWAYKDNDVIQASITQLPLRLAWAITIHKSQGMTLDAAEIDLGDAFEPGMGYVALSRVRRLDGLKMINLNAMALQVHPKILEHDKVFKQCSSENDVYLEDLTPDAIIKQQQYTLINRFAGKKSSKKTASNKQSRGKKPKKQPTHLITLDMLKENPCIETIANMRAITPKTVLQHIEKLKGLKLIKADDLAFVHTRVPKSAFTQIYAALSASEDGKLAPIHNQFDGQYSYENIRLVRLFIGL